MSLTLLDIDERYALNIDGAHVTQDNFDFNCMGFAFDTYNWDEICDFEDWDCYSYWKDVNDEDYFDYEDYVNNHLDEWAEEVVDIYDKVRRIQSLSEVGKNEYAVAMRIGKSDFRFMRKMPDGVWIEKCGAGCIREHDEYEVFNTTWISPLGTNEYDSEIELFAVGNNNCYYD